MPRTKLLYGPVQFVAGPVRYKQSRTLKPVKRARQKGTNQRDVYYVTRLAASRTDTTVSQIALMRVCVWREERERERERRARACVRARTIFSFINLVSKNCKRSVP